MLSIVNLRGGGSAFVLDLSGPTPVIVHWGADLGDSIPAALSASPVAHSALDQPPAQTLVPQSSSGWRGRSALEGHRVGGRAFSAALVTTNSHALAPDGHEITMTDRAAGLTLTIQIHLGQEGMLRIRSILLLGVERFVLDDGWFRHRRNDKAGLGDWYVDGDVWPGGLTGLIDAVRVRGMHFGLWVEPEMVNEDSDVIRAHPDWISGAGLGRTPVDWRHQQVLDLVNPDAFAYIFDRLDALLTDNAISYLKWDQNRDLTEMGHDGSPSTHEQTLAAYRLIDQLRLAHPEVEIESCSSGGARVDLGILERTDRVWAAVALYKKHRGLIHSGVAVHADLVDPAYLLGGTVAQDGSEALFSFVSVASSFDEIPGRVGFPGLDPDTSYDVKVIFPTATSPYGDRANVGWIPGGITATGRFLAEVGLPMPILNPEQGVLIHLEESAGA